MSLLEGDLANSIWLAFKDRLLSGTATRRDPATSGALDDHGDPIDLEPLSWTVQGFTDQYSRNTRAVAGIPDTAVKVCIFSQSSPDYMPKQDDVVTLGTVSPKTVRILPGPIDIDPAGALWTCQGQEIEA